MGIVSVPLFVTRWSFPLSGYPSFGGGFQFNHQGFAPQIGPQPLDSGTPNFTTLISIICDINAPCVSLLNPTAAGAHDHTSSQTWIDDAVCCNCSIPGAAGYNKFKQCFQSREFPDNSVEVGDHNYGFWIGANGGLFDPMPFLDVFGNRIRGEVSLTNTGPTDPYNVYGMFSDIGGPNTFVKFPGISPPAGLNFINYTGGTGPVATYKNLNPLGANNITNYWLIPFNGRAAPWDHPLLTTFTLDQMALQNPVTRSVSLSDPVLDTFFQSLAGGMTIFATSNGYIVRLTTNGAGPTGQPYEFVYCDADMTKYVLLKFVPFGPVPTAQLSRGTTGWNCKIDVNGVLYFNSGSFSDIDQMCYSLAFYNVLFQTRFVPGFDFPQIKDVSIPPYKLPCFDPCPPSG